MSQPLLSEPFALPPVTFWQRLWREPSARRGLMIVALMVLAALAAPMVAAWLGHSETGQFRDSALSDMGLPVGPSAAFPLGADDNGRDVLVRTLYGTRISLLIAVPATTLAMLIGLFVGLFGGYRGGRIDALCQQLINLVLSFPFVVTALSLLALNQGGESGPRVDPVWVVIFVITFFSWGYFARLSRGLVLDLRQQEFVAAAVLMGESQWRILWRDIIPGVLPTMGVYWAIQLPTNIIAEATLSFLGVGIPAPAASLGNMIADVQRSAMYQVQPWFLAAPALALFFIVLGFNCLSSGLRDVLDPHLERR
ncbi:ABC transporter permease [Raoultella sp. WB_B2P2-3]|uniref:ABC transporter permease n=1 Tax=Raoultella scottii TaxID=3040937 RepID=A0ABU8Z715_9ENTR